MSKENYINKIKDLPESLRQFIGLIFITLIVIVSFSILNGFFGSIFSSPVNLNDGEIFDVKKLQDQPVAAFSGIANPNDFRKLLEKSGARVVCYHPFPDHHEYALADLKLIEDSAQESGAKFILTTEKDAVKINSSSITIPLYKVALEMEILEGREMFNQHVLS